MRRSGYYETQPIPPRLNKNVSDLIYRCESRNEAHLREILSPQLQRELELYYGHRPDLMRYKLQPHNESLTSLTDSEFFSDDQASPAQENVAVNLTRLGRFLDFLSRLPLPLSFTGMGLCFLFAVFICPRSCCENLLFPAFRLAFGTLYPAYASYKAVRTKNVKEYVKWMMYWIVYAFFTCIETFTDIFLSWFPFYYEFKVIIVLWLLSPATKGSSTLYRKFVHPMLTRREQEIDEYLNQAKERGYTAVLQLGSKGVNYATNVIMQTALKGGGNLVQTIRRSYSLSDLSEPDVHRTQDEIDDVARPQRLLRPRSQTVRSSSGGRQTSMYFSEVDVEPKIPPANYNYIRSSEDISSGYSSAEPISGGLSRTSSMTNTTRPRFKAKRAEDQNYPETDEYDVARGTSYPLYSPDIPNPLKSYPSAHLNRATCQYLNSLEDWKDEVFLDNENFYQKKEESRGVEVDQNQTKFSAGLDIETMPPEMMEKYLMFCKWLEDTESVRKTAKEAESRGSEFDATSKEVKRLENSVDDFKTEKSIPKQDSDEFQDTISTGSGNDEFVDVIPDAKLDAFAFSEKNLLENTADSDRGVAKVNNPKKIDAFANVVIVDREDGNSEEVENKSESVQVKASIPETETNKTMDTSKTPLISGQILPKKSTDGKSEEVGNKSETAQIKAETVGTSKISLIPEQILSKESSDKLESEKPLESMLKDIRKQAETTLSEFKAILTAPSVASDSKFGSSNPKIDELETHANDSISDLLKRPANHGKGKAPEPPNMSPRSSISEQSFLIPASRSENPPSSQQPYDYHIPSVKAPDLPKRSQLSDLTKPHSRSPSPKPEGKKSKKGLLKNYLPSLFRSESPKSTQQLLDDYHKETQI